MTIGKIFLWVVTFLLCVSLAGCSSETDFPFDGLLTERNEDSPCYAVIIPSDASVERQQLAEELASAIRESVGNHVEIFSEEEAIPEEEEWIEICLGKVDRAWVSKTVKKMKSEDYLCRWIGENILLGGKTDKATEAAVDRFFGELLPVATEGQLFSAEGGFEVKGDYQAEALLLNGVSLSEYRIVYEASNSEALLPLAALIVTRIEAVSGDLPEIGVLSDTNTGGRQIVLRQNHPYGTARMAYVLPEDGNVTLCAGDTFGVSLALREFCDFLLSGAEGERWERTLSTPISVSYDDPVLTLGSFSLEATRSFSSISEVNEAVDLLRRSDSDIVLLGLLDSGQIRYLTDSLAEYEGVSSENGESPAGAIVRNRAMIANGEMDMLYRVGGEEDGFWLCVVADGAEECWKEKLSRIVEQSSLPTVVLIHGESEAVEAKTSDLQAPSLVSVAEASYQKNGKDLRIACYTTPGVFRVSVDNVNNSHGYVCLTLERRMAEKP
ncbi:MAG: hypothetical protein IJY47_07890 [Clostridia bacterium]|nr:hypothetical protein [Clostridia bacterium]